MEISPWWGEYPFMAGADRLGLERTQADCRLCIPVIGGYRKLAFRKTAQTTDQPKRHNTTIAK
jgi:hypothetical protein